MHNCNFNKVNTLARIRGLAWRVEQFVKDSEKSGHPLCAEMFKELEADLLKHSRKLEMAIEGLAKEGKFTFCDDC